MAFLAPFLMAMGTGAASAIGSSMFSPHPPQYGQVQKNNGGQLDFSGLQGFGGPKLNPSIQTPQMNNTQPYMPFQQQQNPMYGQQNPFYGQNQNQYQQYQGLM